MILNLAQYQLKVLHSLKTISRLIKFIEHLWLDLWFHKTNNQVFFWIKITKTL